MEKTERCGHTQQAPPSCVSIAVVSINHAATITSHHDFIWCHRIDGTITVVPSFQPNLNFGISNLANQHKIDKMQTLLLQTILSIPPSYCTFLHSKITIVGDVVPYYTITALVPTLKFLTQQDYYSRRCGTLLHSYRTGTYTEVTVLLL